METLPCRHEVDLTQSESVQASALIKWGHHKRLRRTDREYRFPGQSITSLLLAVRFNIGFVLLQRPDQRLRYRPHIRSFCLPGLFEHCEGINPLPFAVLKSSRD